MLSDPDLYIKPMKTYGYCSHFTNEEAEAKRIIWSHGHNGGNRFEFWHSNSTVLNYINIYTLHIFTHTQFCVLFWVTYRICPQTSSGTIPFLEL